MPRRPKIRITLIDRKGPCPCHRGHRVGDSWDFDKDRGNLCPMAMHVAFPYVDILRYGGEIPQSSPQRDGIFFSQKVNVTAGGIGILPQPQPVMGRPAADNNARQPVTVIVQGVDDMPRAVGDSLQRRKIEPRQRALAGF